MGREDAEGKRRGEKTEKIEEGKGRKLRRQ